MGACNSATGVNTQVEKQLPAESDIHASNSRRAGVLLRAHALHATPALCCRNSGQRTSAAKGLPPMWAPWKVTDTE